MWYNNGQNKLLSNYYIILLYYLSFRVRDILPLLSTSSTCYTFVFIEQQAEEKYSSKCRQGLYSLYFLVLSLRKYSFVSKNSMHLSLKRTDKRSNDLLNNSDSKSRYASTTTLCCLYFNLTQTYTRNYIWKSIFFFVQLLYIAWLTKRMLNLTNS